MTGAAPSVALFYGAHAPLDELKAFDIAVVDPDHGYDPVKYRKPYSELYAYASVGEVHPSRTYFNSIPQSAKLTANAAWGSAVIDLSRPEWPNFFAANVIQPLWDRGYRGFFLDTLDAYRLAPRFDETAQQKGLTAVIEALHRRFPGIRLIMNRGFDVLPAVKDKVQMVAAESLFRSWDAANKRYREVAERDREWLLGQLRKVRDDYGLPVLAIDYVPAEDRALARATAEKIKALGIVPWVADGALETLGIGQVEVQPRKVMALYDGREAPTLNDSTLHRFAEMPLNYLGYTAEYHDINRPLPEIPLPGRYAAIVIWLNGTPQNPQALAVWLRRQVAAGIKVALFGQFGLPSSPSVARAFGLALGNQGTSTRVSIARQDAMFGFEAPALPDSRNLQPLRLMPGTGSALLELTDERGQHYDAAAITAWGGYVLSPFVIQEVPGTEQFRWLVDPFAFLRQSLHLPPIPVPDTTTENGRRLMFIHIDGDGFPSRAELPGTPLAGRALLDEVLKRYKLPTTMSIIEAEISPDGLHPKDAAEMEDIARNIFSLPYVEIASHTYSHPFRWETAVRHGNLRDTDADEAYHLQIPGYKLNLEREIVGSMNYIRARLAPSGKPADIVLWSGDAAPGEDALRIASDAGLLNMNGGDTFISRSYPSLAAVSALGIEKGGYRQIYAPVTNENIYTNLWQGPFYGFERVVETFEMTERPRRLKPIDIYYHVYSASKRASLNALHKVYAWSLAQPVHVIHASNFIRKANDFYTDVVARDGDTWIFRGDGSLRTLRAPEALGYPDSAASSGLAGFAKGAEGSYLHLTGAESRIRFAAAAPKTPYLQDANARLVSWSNTGTELQFALEGYRPLDFTLANVGRCEVRANDKTLTPRKTGTDTAAFHLDHAAAKIRISCRNR